MLVLHGVTNLVSLLTILLVTLSVFIGAEDVSVVLLSPLSHGDSVCSVALMKTQLVNLQSNYT